MAPSPRQISFFDSLLRDRAVPESLRHEAEAVRENGTGRDVSAMIDRLKACPFASRGNAPTVTEPGVYRKDGKVYIVKPTRETAKLDPSERKLYAKVAVEIGGTRLTEFGEVVDVEFEYANGAIFLLSPEDRVPFADAKALTIRYGRCIVCGRHLKAAQSVERGIGPVCRTYFPDAEQAGVKVVAEVHDEARIAHEDDEARAAAEEPIPSFDEGAADGGRASAQAVEAYEEGRECLDGPQGCAGSVEFRMPLSGTGRSFARCDGHWAERVDKQQQINERYPQLPPSGFDPAYAGERW